MNGPKSQKPVALIGKGVCFDTGGLDLKTSAGMALMKKDMGGAACALALAQLVMDARLPVRLRLIVPAVENSVAGDAYRPGDVLATRAGQSVEVTNTDAEGRLVLADALALACEERPDLLVDLATLTGAARVALGPELPALYASDDALAAELAAHGRAAGDPLWPMPRWTPDEDALSSKVAAVANASSSGFAGSVTAALFLRRFVAEPTPWLHVDLYAWNGKERPGRPVGGEAQALRALYALLAARYGGAGP
jgi:leucyl aminopeptidase